MLLRTNNGAQINYRLIGDRTCARVAYRLWPPTSRRERRVKMSSFALPGAESAVTVNLVPDLSKDQILFFPAFKTWVSTLQHSLSLQKQQSHTFHATPYVLRQIDVQAVDFFGERIGFLKLKAEISNKNGETLPGAVFLRGGSVAMMVGDCGVYRSLPI